MPEQYDAFLNGKLVGLLHVRGEFTVTYPDVHGKIIYEVDPFEENNLDCGEFISMEQRDFYLNKAKEKIVNELLKN